MPDAEDTLGDLAYQGNPAALSARLGQGGDPNDAAQFFSGASPLFCAARCELASSRNGSFCVCLKANAFAFCVCACVRACVRARVHMLPVVALPPAISAPEPFR